MPRLPPEVLGNIEENLDWITRYRLLQTNGDLVSCLNSKVSCQTYHHNSEKSSDICWKFGPKSEQTITVLPDYRGNIDGVLVRTLRHANEVLFRWTDRRLDNVWANHHNVRESHLILQVPLHLFEYLLNETPKKAEPIRFLAKDLQLTDPPISNVFASVAITDRSTGQEKGRMEWLISRKAGVRLEDVMTKVWEDIKSVAEDLPPVEVRFWKSVCPNRQEINMVHNSGERYRPASEAKVRLRTEFILPSRYSAREVIAALNSGKSWSKLPKWQRKL